MVECDPAIPGFSIERLIGKGSLGAVYAAFDETLQRRVALKVLHAGTSGSAREKILDEARKSAALDEPAIVTIYSIADGEPPADGLGALDQMAHRSLTE